MRSEVREWKKRSAGYHLVLRLKSFCLVRGCSYEEPCPRVKPQSFSLAKTTYTGAALPLGDDQPETKCHGEAPPPFTSDPSHHLWKNRHSPSAIDDDGLLVSFVV